MDWQGGLEQAWNNVAAFVPKLLACLVILIIGYFIAKAIEKILDRLLERVGFDRWVERGGIKRALARSKLDASSILARIVFYALMLVVLSTAFGVFGDNPISGYLDAAVAYLPKVFVAILIIVIAAAIASGVKTLVESSLGGLSYGRVLANVASVVIIALGVIAALDQLEVAENVVNAVLYASLAAIVGVVVVAVGGGGIQPMQERWRRALARYDEEKDVVASRMSSGQQRMPAGVMQDPAAMGAAYRGQPGAAQQDPYASQMPTETAPLDLTEQQQRAGSHQDPRWNG
jgi:small-conductance mechanosensitive channel